MPSSSWWHMAASLHSLGFESGPWAQSPVEYANFMKLCFASHRGKEKKAARVHRIFQSHQPDKLYRKCPPANPPSCNGYDVVLWPRRLRFASWWPHFMSNQRSRFFGAHFRYTKKGKQRHTQTKVHGRKHHAATTQARCLLGHFVLNREGHVPICAQIRRTQKGWRKRATACMPRVVGLIIPAVPAREVYCAICQQCTGNDVTCRTIAWMKQQTFAVSL